MCFDEGVSVTTDRGTELTIDTVFTVQPQAGSVQCVNSGDAAHCGMLRRFVGRSVRGLSVTNCGRLFVSLSGGDTIVGWVEAYEAWSISAAYGFVAIAVPGGGVAAPQRSSVFFASLQVI